MNDSQADFFIDQIGNVTVEQLLDSNPPCGIEGAAVLVSTKNQTLWLINVDLPLNKKVHLISAAYKTCLKFKHLISPSIMHPSDEEHDARFYRTEASSLRDELKERTYELEEAHALIDDLTLAVRQYKRDSKIMLIICALAWVLTLAITFSHVQS